LPHLHRAKAAVTTHFFHTEAGVFGDASPIILGGYCPSSAA
jgi:hypothetical protein